MRSPRKRSDEFRRLRWLGGGVPGHAAKENDGDYSGPLERREKEKGKVIPIEDTGEIDGRSREHRGQSQINQRTVFDADSYGPDPANGECQPDGTRSVLAMASSKGGASKRIALNKDLLVSTGNKGRGKFRRVQW